MGIWRVFVSPLVFGGYFEGFWLVTGIWRVLNGILDGNNGVISALITVNVNNTPSSGDNA